MEKDYNPYLDPDTAFLVFLYCAVLFYFDSVRAISKLLSAPSNEE